MEGMARLPVLPPCTSSSRASAAHGPCLSRLGLSLDSPSFPLRSCFAPCLASRFASCFACFPFLSFFASFSFCFSFCYFSWFPPCAVESTANATQIPSWIDVLLHHKPAVGGAICCYVMLPITSCPCLIKPFTRTMPIVLRMSIL